jgi:hypothetical protein
MTKYTFKHTDTTVTIGEGDGQLTFGVGGPVAALLIGDLVEEVNTQADAIAAAREALVVAKDWAMNRNKHCGCGAAFGELHKINCSYLALLREINGALEKLGA